MSTTTTLAPLLEFLSTHCGHYRGEGTNFEGQGFLASLEMRAQIHDQLIEIRFRAEDHESAFHEEVSWIATDLLSNQVALWCVSSNAPGVLRHDLVSDESRPEETSTRARRMVFRLGAPDDTRIFRQEITLDIMYDGSIEYRYAWGIPHEKLQPRVRAVLKADD